MKFGFHVKIGESSELLEATFGSGKKNFESIVYIWLSEVMPHCYQFNILSCLGRFSIFIMPCPFLVYSIFVSRTLSVILASALVILHRERRVKLSDKNCVSIQKPKNLGGLILQLKWSKFLNEAREIRIFLKNISTDSIELLSLLLHPCDGSIEPTYANCILCNTHIYQIQKIGVDYI